MTISNCNVRSVLKTNLFGIIALLVLAVSVPSAFAQSTESEEISPIRMVLDLTRGNLEDSLDSVDDIPSTAQTFYDMGNSEYEKANDALANGDFEAAEEHALIAMALFEDSASVIGELGESAVLDQLPPGFGAAVGSGVESEGQGLGVGGISPGIINQLSASNIFEIQEEITGIDEEVGGLSELIESNGLDVNLEEYYESVNLAKEVLANGDIPNAQAKLALANEIKDNLYEQINAAVEDNQDTRVQEFADERIEDIESILEKGEDLGLTQKTIDELQDTLEVLQSGEFDEIIEKTGEDSEFVKEVEENSEIVKEFEDVSADETPEDSADETPEDSADETPEDSADETPEDSADETPEDSADETPEDSVDETVQNFEDNKEPGQTNEESAIQFTELYYSEFGEYSPDDYFADGDAIEDMREAPFEENFDKMNKDSKGKVKSEQAKQAKLDRIAAAAAGGGGGHGGPKGNVNGGNPNCDDEGVTDLESANTSGEVGVDYIIDGLSAIGSSCMDATNQMMITVNGPTSPPSFASLFGNEQPFTFQPDEVGLWTLAVSAQGQFYNRTIDVSAAGGIVANAGLNQTVTEGDLLVTLDGSGSTDDVGITSYSWAKISPATGGPNSPTLSPDNSAVSPTFTAPIVNSETIYIFELTVTDVDSNEDRDRVYITVQNVGVNAPGQVEGVGGSATSSTSIDISWTAPADDGGSAITGYKIERKITTGGNPWIEVDSDTSPDASVTYSDNTVSANTKYRYKVSAINDEGIGSVSAQSGQIQTPQ